MSWLSPEMEKRFLEGEQALRLIDGIYNSIASDMIIECTWMRKGKKMERLFTYWQYTESPNSCYMGAESECNYNFDK